MTEQLDPRSRRWEQTHQRIYETAMTLFADQGFDKVAVGQIAARSGVSVPTFYAHYPSKEHIVLQLPNAAEVAAVLAEQPTELPVGERVRRSAVLWLSQFGSEERPELLARWRIVAGNPVLRLRAAEYERTTAHLVVDALTTEPDAAVRPSDGIVVAAYLSAFTAGMLAWADSDGQVKLEDCLDEAFDALR